MNDSKGFESGAAVLVGRQPPGWHPRHDTGEMRYDTMRLRCDDHTGNWDSPVPNCVNRQRHTQHSLACLAQSVGDPHPD